MADDPADNKDESVELEFDSLVTPKEHVYAASYKVPTVYADYLGVAQPGIGNIRVSFLRADSEMFGRDDSPRLFPVLQLVMPYAGFAHLVIYLEEQAKRLARSDKGFAEKLKVLRDDLERYKETLRKKEQEGAEAEEKTEQNV